MHTLFSIQFLTSIPYWVYIIFILILIRGFRATRPQQSSLQKIQLLFWVFLGIGIFKISKLIQGGSYEDVALWLVFSLALFFIGWIKGRQTPITLDKTNQKLLLPGSWDTFIYLLFIFGGSFYVGYHAYLRSAVVYHPYFSTFKLFMSATPTSFFLGKTCNYLYRYRNNLIGPTNKENDNSK